MAQIELRFFDGSLGSIVKNEISAAVQGIVFREHYPELVRSRRIAHGIRVHPGDITLVVPLLDTELSSSDAQYEVEISEGSDNWPLRLDESVASDLQMRAQRVSQGLIAAFGGISHNVFEVNGNETGWAQYKLSDRVE